MSELTTVVEHDPYPGEYWTQQPHYRLAVLAGSTDDPPILQCVWQSNYGRIKWRRVETVVVNRDEYEA